ncbi:MAG: transposase [Draconibacterium sp.]
MYKKDYVRPIVSVPPKISISQLMETLKAKQQSRFSKVILQLRTKQYWGNHFWAKGYCVDPINVKDKIKKYVKYQEDQECLEEQQGLNFGPL